MDERASDRELRILRGLPQVSELFISGAAITDNGMRHVRTLRNVSNLHLGDVPITDRGLRHLAGMPALRWLSIERLPVTRETFHLFSSLPALNDIRIVDIRPEGPGLGDILFPLGLQEVHLSGCGLTDEDLKPLAKLQFIRRLTLTNNRIRGPGLAHVAASRGIASLYLGGNSIDDSYLALLAPLTLIGLDVDGVRLSETGVAMIERQGLLQFLSSRNSEITDEQLRRILANTRLQDGHFDASKLSHRIMREWHARDVTLYVEHRKLDADDIARLADFGLDVHLVECEFTPGAIAEFANHSGLFTLINCPIEARFEDLLRKYADFQ